MKHEIKLNCGDYIFGYWVDGILVCPWCFDNLRQAPMESLSPADWFDAHFGKCDLCGWPLWGLYRYEKYLERRKSLENQFDVSDNFSDLDKSVFKDEIELVGLLVYNTDRSISRNVLTGVTHDESIISLEGI